MKVNRKNIISRISHWGVRPDHTPVFAKRIILTNLLGLLFVTNMSVSTLAFLYFKQYSLAVFTAIFVLTEFSWPVFNYFGRYNISRVGMLVSSNLLGLMVSVALPGTGYNRGFFVMAGLPILLFGLKEKGFILLGFLLPLLLYPFSEWAQYHLPLMQSLELSGWTVQFIRYSIGTIYVCLIFLMFLFLSRENARAEEQLEEQRLRSFSSAKFAALGEMAAGIGHEINNPLTVISLNTDQLKYILKSPENDKEVAFQRLEVISKTVHRVAGIIDAMRTFSREASNDSYQSESVQKIVQDTLTFCSERFKHHQIKLEINFSSEGMQLNCRSVQISQVLLNLLNNAFDAIENLHEKWIRLDIYQSPDGKIKISVTDSGSSIHVSEREKIFLPFYTTKPVGKGTGLGLSLSRKIIEDHAGILILDPSSTHTKFVIELPGAGNEQH